MVIPNLFTYNVCTHKTIILQWARLISYSFAAWLLKIEKKCSMLHAFQRCRTRANTSRCQLKNSFLSTFVKSVASVHVTDPQSNMQEFSNSHCRVEYEGVHVCDVMTSVYFCWLAMTSYSLATVAVKVVVMSLRPCSASGVNLSPSASFR